MNLINEMEYFATNLNELMHLKKNNNTFLSTLSALLGNQTNDQIQTNVQPYQSTNLHSGPRLQYQLIDCPTV